MSQKLIQKIMNNIFKFSGMISLFLLVIIILYIVVNGINVINFEFIFSNPIDSGRDGGIFPMILSSFYLLIIAMSIAIPVVGVGSAIYIVEYNENQKLAMLVMFLSQTLASIPSIVFGLAGLAFFVFFLKLGWSILTAGLILSLMSIPTIFQVSEMSLKNVSKRYKEGSYGLGATKWQCIKTIILPTAIGAIFTGIILALTRAFSEAAAVMYLVGSTIDIPTSLLDTGRPLPLHLYVLASEGISIENAYGTAFVLLIIVLGITLFSNYMISNYQAKQGVME